MKILEQFDKFEESSLSRLIYHTDNHDCTTLTAYRSEYTHKENQQRNKSLLAEILSSGFKVTSVEGVYIENLGTDTATKTKEHVFFVVDWKDEGKLKYYIKRWGSKFEQDSVLFIPKKSKSAVLIGTKEGGYPGYGKEEVFSLRQFGKSDNPFLTYVDGRPMYFISESIGNPQYCGGNMGRWAARMVADKDWRTL
jgi:hypothetical protein